MHAMPFMWALRPLSRLDRVGEHSAVVCQLVYRRPRSAMRWRLGIAMAPP